MKRGNDMTGKFHFKEPGSAITHLIGFIAAFIAGIPLMVKVAHIGTGSDIAVYVVYLCSMLALYASSTTYHTFDLSAKINKLLKRIDHMMIFVFIAGCYTPICAIALKGQTGFVLLSCVWGIAIVGIIIKFFWIYCPKWFSSILYIAMGWVVLFAFSPLYKELPRAGFYWLLAGGIIYTIGGIIYALKLPLLNKHFPNFGSHEIFHLFVMAGSICHFIVMYQYVLAVN